MEFPLDQELEGGAQELLLRLRDTKLTDDLLLEEFYDKVIENYEFAENYYIILIQCWFSMMSGRLELAKRRCQMAPRDGSSASASNVLS